MGIGFCNIGYHSKIQFKLQSCNILLLHNIHFHFYILQTPYKWYCNVQDFKIIRSLRNSLWANKILWDLGLRWDFLYCNSCQTTIMGYEYEGENTGASG